MECPEVPNKIDTGFVGPDVFNIVESTPQGPLVNKRIERGHLVEWVNDREVQEATGGAVPKFKMIELSGHASESGVGITFDTVVCGFFIPPWLKVFVLAHQPLNGFFQSYANGMHRIWTFQFSTDRGSVTWSYSTSTASTRAVYLSDGEDFTTRLRRHMIFYSGSSHHPVFPGFVLAETVVHDVIESLEGIHRELVMFEEVTAYGGVHREKLEKIIKMDNKVFKERHQLNTARKIMLFLLVETSHPLATEALVWNDVANVARCYLDVLDSLEQRLTVMEKRVANQLTTIFNLVAREDTKATIQLAEAAKRDSSSMKTLAVVTMAFLPATFLATVFAMPSLSTSPPTGPGLKVFLAIAIPTTVAILLLWAGVTQRQIIRDLWEDGFSPQGFPSQGFSSEITYPGR
ncbi:hypothetical protein GE09DRAFT_1284507 [Coniochaeta sp. 2T2.1]|nr:hypothetical protein GE09DRAFT_1284507 [Coniochaeta sp. 2T2.1]